MAHNPRLVLVLPYFQLTRTRDKAGGWGRNGTGTPSWGRLVRRKHISYLEFELKLEAGVGIEPA